jgi:hypothetical protein
MDAEPPPPLSATSAEGTVAFRLIQEPSGRPVEYLKGIETERGLKEVPEEEIIKGYKHTKAQYVLRCGTLDSVGHGVEFFRIGCRLESSRAPLPYRRLQDGIELAF